jgi:hypothetical protein
LRDFVFEDLDALGIAFVKEERDGLADESDGSLEVAARSDFLSAIYRSP